MTKAKLALALLLASTLAAPAMAQTSNAPRFKDIDAERINATQVIIDLEYANGGCDDVAAPTLGATTNGALEVNFGVTGTLENCTRQGRDRSVTYTIDAPEAVTQLNVVLTAADGVVIGGELVNIDRD